MMGSVKKKFLGSGHFLVSGVRLGQPHLGLDNFPQKTKKYFYPLGQKILGSKMGRPLIYCVSKVC